jgi:hypothetical protein
MAPTAVEKQVFPDCLDRNRVAAEQTGGEVIVQQRQYRRTASADRVCITGPGALFVVDDSDQQRFLPHERLDRVGAYHLRLQVDLTQFNAPDPAHSGTPGGCGATNRMRRRACCLAAAKLA